MLLLLRRSKNFPTVRVIPHALTCLCTFRSFASRSVNLAGHKAQSMISGDESSRSQARSEDLFLSPLFSQHQSPLSSSEIKVVDSDTWQLSLGFADVSKNTGFGPGNKSFSKEEYGDEFCSNHSEAKDELDLDEIEDMRIHGNLFYKIERNSKEFEECKFEFHRRKPQSTKKNEGPDHERQSKGMNHLKREEEKKERNMRGSQDDSLCVNDEEIARIIKEKYVVCAPDDGNKKLRKPTFNQITGPYHEPFCLDIFVSKQSVRACIVHRATSKVVAVAHSISKDMKFDLESTRNATACDAVGKVLAQRALEDDIHDVIFTPRKGDKLEGKLQVVLQAVMDGGVNVKVKLKKRNTKKAVGQYGLS